MYLIMVYMLEKLFHNADLDIGLASYIDDKIFGSKVKTLLWSLDIVTQIRPQEYMLMMRTNSKVPSFQRGYFQKGPPHFPVVSTGYSQRGRPPIFINESGFYSLVLSSKLEPVKTFKHWVTSKVLPSIRKYGQYKLYDNPHNYDWQWDRWLAMRQIFIIKLLIS